MLEPTKQYYEKRAKILVQNLKNRQFEAAYCENREDALKQALEWIPKGSTVGFGGATSAQQIGLAVVQIYPCLLLLRLQSQCNFRSWNIVLHGAKNPLPAQHLLLSQATFSLHNHYKRLLF